MSTNHVLAPTLEVPFYKYLLELDLSNPVELEPALRRAVRVLAQATNADLVYLEISDLGHQVRIGATPDGDLEPSLAPPSQFVLDVAETGDSAEAQQPLPATAWRRLAPIAGIVYVRRAAPFSSAALEALDLFASRVAHELLHCPHIEGISLEDATLRFRRQQILAMLERTNWNISKAARELVIARSYLYKLIQALNLRPTNESPRARRALSSSAHHETARANERFEARSSSLLACSEIARS